MKSIFTKSAPTRCKLKSKRLTIMFERKSHTWFPGNFIRKPVWISICCNFQWFWIYEDSYTLTFPSPLQLLNSSRATKGETANLISCKTADILPDHLLYVFLLCLAHWRHFFFCNLTMPWDSELTGYISFFTVTTIYASIFTCMDQVLSNCELSWCDLNLFRSKMYQVQRKKHLG